MQDKVAYPTIKFEIKITLCLIEESHLYLIQLGIILSYLGGGIN